MHTLTPWPATGGLATHGGSCGAAVKPIALNIVSEIARSASTRGLRLAGIGGIETWKDAVEYIALGCGSVQVCTAAKVYGFKIVKEIIDYMGAKGFATVDAMVGLAVPKMTDGQNVNLDGSGMGVLSTCFEHGSSARTPTPNLSPQGGEG